MTTNTMTETLVMLEVRDGVGTILLDRPPLNVLNAEVQRQIITLAREADKDPQVCAVVLYGGERTLAAGADIAEMAVLDPGTIAGPSRLLQEFTSAIAAITKPTVAAITGHALGGGLELALATDLRFASDTARLGLPEVTLGIIPGAGGTQRLARLVGPARAKDLIYTGRILTAVEAEKIGLVDEVVPEAEVYPRAVEWARQFARGPARALAAAKRAIDEGLDQALPEASATERTMFSALFATDDQKIGMQAFIAKEKPAFRGC